MAFYLRCFVVLVIAPASASLAVGCSRDDASTARAATPGQTAQAPRVPVSVALVEQRAVPIELRAIGTAQAFSVVEIRSQITGELTSVNFREGDDVQQGQVLFTLDRRPLEAALQTAEGNLERDTAQAENAATSAKRYQDLLARGIATEGTGRPVDDHRRGARARRWLPIAARSRTRGCSCSTRRSVAPIQGRTGQLRVNPGNLVRANDTDAARHHQPGLADSRRVRRARRAARRAEALSQRRGRCASKRRRRARPIRARRGGSRSSTTRSIRPPA